MLEMMGEGQRVTEVDANQPQLSLVIIKHTKDDSRATDLGFLVTRTTWGHNLSSLALSKFCLRYHIILFVESCGGIMWYT